ncbi:hypothetical protein MATL_G00163850 [Megalops atlanticus]|uniref:Uncharacterized protein n=1 Tax=Megalops atlanticus TaxID=7932 RepID=A0A9D3PTQ4_MEGAT|nr:hypothetical protein MATL_G00163850 [Megalops atlanticus]
MLYVNFEDSKFNSTKVQHQISDLVKRVRESPDEDRGGVHQISSSGEAQPSADGEQSDCIQEGHGVKRARGSSDKDGGGVHQISSSGEAQPSTDGEQSDCIQEGHVVHHARESPDEDGGGVHQISSSGEAQPSADGEQSDCIQEGRGVSENHLTKMEEVSIRSPAVEKLNPQLMESSLTVSRRAIG